jgi:hypothetical protein
MERDSLTTESEEERSLPLRQAWPAWIPTGHVLLYPMNRRLWFPCSFKHLSEQVCFFMGG